MAHAGGVLHGEGKPRHYISLIKSGWREHQVSYISHF
jgi:hypothetical protein